MDKTIVALETQLEFKLSSSFASCGHVSNVIKTKAKNFTIFSTEEEKGKKWN